MINEAKAGTLVLSLTTGPPNLHTARWHRWPRQSCQELSWERADSASCVTPTHTDWRRWNGARGLSFCEWILSYGGTIDRLLGRHLPPRALLKALPVNLPRTDCSSGSQVTSERGQRRREALTCGQVEKVQRKMRSRADANLRLSSAYRKVHERLSVGVSSNWGWTSPSQISVWQRSLQGHCFNDENWCLPVCDSSIRRVMSHTMKIWFGWFSWS